MMQNTTKFQLDLHASLLARALISVRSLSMQMITFEDRTWSFGKSSTQEKKRTYNLGLRFLSSFPRISLFFLVYLVSDSTLRAD